MPFPMRILLPIITMTQEPKRIVTIHLPLSAETLANLLFTICTIVHRDNEVTATCSTNYSHELYIEVTPRELPTVAPKPEEPKP